ncbi:hypothetical protein CFOL_v3_05477, partial [Cephalotus follicularis]
WLANMYTLLQHWVKAYLKDTFFAGMTTNGQSESIHAVFDGYVNAKSNLIDFVRQYDRAIKSDKHQWKTVEFDWSGDILANFSCAKYETERLLCKHIMYMLRKKQVQTIPKRYILRRQTLDARYHISSVMIENYILC